MPSKRFTQYQAIKSSHAIMEDDDDLVPEVDGRGVLNIANRAWVKLEPDIWTM